MTETAPAWLLAAVDQRLALMKEAAHDAGMPPGKAFGDYELVTTPLTEPREGATKAEFDRWDRSCDNCGVFCPKYGEPILYTGHINRELGGARVVITFGACAKCKEMP